MDTAAPATGTNAQFETIDLLDDGLDPLQELYDDLLQYQTYQYSPIVGEDSIRLLKVLDAGDDVDAVLECELFEDHISSSPKYAALSYTWGDSKHPKRILLNGKPFQIRQNLWEFLWEFRRQRGNDFLWADAICIDQNNPRERKDQVNIMRDIYSNATVVRIWLGPTSSNEFGLSWFFSSLNPQFKQTTQSVAQGPENIPEAWHSSIPLDTKFSVRSLWSELNELLQRDYWQRTWIIQEIILARHIVVHYGGLFFPWSDLVNIPELLSKEHSIPTISTTLKQFISWSRCFKLDQLRNDFGSTPRTLADLVVAHGQTKCSDVRDRIYGFLSLASDCCSTEGFTADYEIDKIQLMLRVLQHDPRIPIEDLSAILKVSGKSFLGSQPRRRPMTDSLSQTVFPLGILKHVDIVSVPTNEFDRYVARCTVDLFRAQPSRDPNGHELFSEVLHCIAPVCVSAGDVMWSTASDVLNTRAVLITQNVGASGTPIAAGILYARYWRVDDGFLDNMVLGPAQTQTSAINALSEFGSAYHVFSGQGYNQEWVIAIRSILKLDGQESSKSLYGEPTIRGVKDWPQVYGWASILEK